MCGLQETVVLSAYADDVLVFITKQEDVLRRTFPGMDNTGHKSLSYTCPYRREVRA